jgi:two-component system chemotaxis response regulator CheB
MVKVLIVDDSAIVRNVLEEELSRFPEIEVVGTAPDPFVARNKILSLKPDVLTLDIEMPRMDGLTFLKKLMDYYPIPVIIVSSVTAEDAAASIRALEIGAFDVVNKPSGSISVKEAVQEIHDKLISAYNVKDTYLSRRSAIIKNIKPATALKQNDYLQNLKTTESIIAIGSSTGGTLALEYLFKALPANLPPILVVQHMPPVYTGQFARRLDELSRLRIKESEDGEPVQKGTVYIARGGQHLTLRRKGASLYIEHTDTERVQYQRPAVDVLFHSVAQTMGQNAAGFLLTGMGRDGAAGLLAMKNAGALTVAQDEHTSIVYGMPRAAAEIGACQEVQPLDQIPQRILDYATGEGKKAQSR